MTTFGDDARWRTHDAQPLGLRDDLGTTFHFVMLPQSGTVILSSK
ncbi:MAG: hypothetical protein RL341_751 [Pseudomonadota bacterium]|jgi:hypothetical protein